MSAGAAVVGQCQQGAPGAQFSLLGPATGTKALKRGTALSRSSPVLALGVPWSEVREAYLQQLTWPGGAAPVDYPSRKAVFAQLSAARKNGLTKLDGESAAATAVGSAAADDASAESTIGTLIAQNTSRSLSTLAELRKELGANLEESLQGSVPWPSKLVSRPAPSAARLPVVQTEEENQQQEQEPWAPPWEPCEPSWEPPLGSTSGSLDLSTWSSGGGGATIRLQASCGPTTAEPGLGRPQSALLEPLDGEDEERRRQSAQRRARRAEAGRAAPGAGAASAAADGGRHRRHAGALHGQPQQPQQPWRPLPGEGTRAPLSRGELGEVSWQDAFGDLPPQPKRELLPLGARGARPEHRHDSRATASSFPSLRALRTCAESDSSTTRGSTPRSSSSSSSGATAPPPRGRCDQLPPLPAGGEASALAPPARPVPAAPSANGAGAAPPPFRPLQTLAQMCGVGGSRRGASRSVPCAKAGRAGWTGRGHNVGMASTWA